MNSFEKAPILLLEEVASTNTYLLNLLNEKKIEEGTIVSAKNQSAGRGMGNNVWISEIGKNATFSIVLFPDFTAVEEQFLITQLISLGVLNWVKSRLPGKNCVIKWPNDILVEGKKICGILAQSSILGNKLQYVVAGIGINLNQKDFGTLNSLATSIINQSGKISEIEESIYEIRNEIYKQYQILTSGKTEVLQKKYLDALHLLNDNHLFSDTEGLFTGKISGVNRFGQLQITDTSGRIRIYNTKEVVYEDQATIFFSSTSFNL